MQFNSDIARAIAWMMGALLSFTVMAISVRELSDDLHAFQMLFVRSGIGVLMLAVIVQVSGGKWGQLRTVRIGSHVFRNVVHFGGQTFWILGIALLPLATVAAIEFTTPIWGALLAVLFLGERMNPGRWAAFGLGFVGILVVLRPGLSVIELGAVIMLACTFCFGATNAITKWLTRTEGTLLIVFYMVLMQTGFGAFASYFVWEPIVGWHWPWLVLLAITGLTAHYSLTSALAAVDATLIMPFEFLRLPIVALVGFFLYQEGFELIVLLGAVLIFAGNYFSLRYESRLKRQAGR